MPSWERAQISSPSLYSQKTVDINLSGTYRTKYRKSINVYFFYFSITVHPSLLYIWFSCIAKWLDTFYNLWSDPPDKSSITWHHIVGWCKKCIGSIHGNSILIEYFIDLKLETYDMRNKTVIFLKMHTYAL